MGLISISPTIRALCLSTSLTPAAQALFGCCPQWSPTSALKRDSPAGRNDWRALNLSRSLLRNALALGWMEGGGSEGLFGSAWVTWSTLSRKKRSPAPITTRTEAIRREFPNLMTIAEPSPLELQQTRRLLTPYGEWKTKCTLCEEPRRRSVWQEMQSSTYRLRKDEEPGTLQRALQHLMSMGPSNDEPCGDPTVAGECGGIQQRVYSDIRSSPILMIPTLTDNTQRGSYPSITRAIMLTFDDGTFAYRLIGFIRNKRGNHFITSFQVQGEWWGFDDCKAQSCTMRIPTPTFLPLDLSMICLAKIDG